MDQLAEVAEPFIRDLRFLEEQMRDCRNATDHQQATVVGLCAVHLQHGQRLMVSATRASASHIALREVDMCEADQGGQFP
ncbi:MAG: hypothetical protein R3B91_01700 [Planctomycetaceae bacterium]